MSETVIKIDNVYKEYRLGTIGGGTLQGDIQSWWARVRGKDDPNLKIGEKVYKKNERFTALNGISFEVNKGDTLGIIGGNGAGKSTILKILSRVTAPTDGEVYIKGRISSMLEVGTGFNGELTGRENIYLNGAILGMSKAEVDSKIEDIIEFSECRQFIDTPVKRYSSGMYVKLAFSVAAHLDSEILVMDEVLAVGDMKFQQKCLKKMSDVANKERRTVLYVSHNMNTIRQLCNRCVVLNKGSVVYDGEVDQAIRIYSGNNSTENQSTYDFRETPRPFEQHGKKIFITDFSFINKEAAVFERTEPFEFSINFDAVEDIENLKLYFTLNSLAGDRVGTAQTYEGFLNALAGKSYQKSFKFDISNLAKGNYYFQIDLFSDDGTGRFLSYDHPLCDITFEIVDSKRQGIRWNSQHFGSVLLNSVLPIDEEIK